MPSDFKDYFSGHSKDYGHYRPEYPDELYFHLAHLTPRHDCAWDCATGTGQAALQLTRYYKQVIATDASENQISQAKPHKQIRYVTAQAEQSGLDSNSVDLITVAQALHWFDLDAFAREADRVLVEQGILAAWSYNLLKITADIDELVNDLYYDLLGDYWPAERRIVENQYRDIELPFTELEAPRFNMHTSWNMHQLCGYLNTWSAVKRYESEKNTSPVAMMIDDLGKAWGNPEQERAVYWPLTLRIWQK
jgi:SAM-dependent methyltransferase